MGMGENSDQSMAANSEKKVRDSETGTTGVREKEPDKLAPTEKVGTFQPWQLSTITSIYSGIRPTSQEDCPLQPGWIAPNILFPSICFPRPITVVMHDPTERFGQDDQNKLLIQCAT